VWTGDDGSVHMYDFSTGNETKISSKGSSPDIYGNYIVYTKYYFQDKNYGIYLYDLNTHNESKISDVQGDPAIYDKKVVWSQINNNSGYDICVYNISTNQTNTITTTNSLTFESEPDIYGNVVLWSDFGNIYTYDTTSNKKIQVTITGSAYDPAIFGNRIVYAMRDPYVEGSTDIYMYEISTAKTTRITTSNRAFSPSIYGDKIVYADCRNDPENYSIRDIYLYDLNPEAEKLKALFVTDVRTGAAPLNVSFSDISSGMPKTWYWDFGDGTNLTQQNPTHSYLSAGNYTVNLTVSDANGTDSMSAAITVSEKPVLPVANFSTNVSEGDLPLSVLFTDLSENENSHIWNFGDGTCSTEQNPVHTYSSEGVYYANLSVNNANGTNSTGTTIRAMKRIIPPVPHGGSGDAGGSPEPQSNVEIKELSQAFITNGQAAHFDFPQKAIAIESITFDPKKTVGKTTTIVEMLKNKSTLTSGVPSDEVYKYINIWVGNGGYATEKNIENAVIGFKVAKTWVQDKKIDKSTITLNRYNDKTWNQIPTILSNEDDNFLYFTAKTPGFSPFAITGRGTATGTVQPIAVKETPSAVDNIQNNTKNKTLNIDQTHNRTKSTNTSGKEGTKTPDFEISSVIICLLSVILYKKR
jgi:PGF-pre-PGF domain-containing protein